MQAKKDKKNYKYQGAAIIILVKTWSALKTVILHLKAEKFYENKIIKNNAIWV